MIWPERNPQLAASRQLISALQNRSVYDHPVTQFSVIETHISWVILTGHFAYKIKKPVDFGFVDFSTLHRRHHFCVEEIRLNRRFAKDLYLDIIAISGSHENPSFSKDNKVIEYAVKMREFSQSDLLDSYASDHRLKPDHIDSLADVVAQFHRSAAHAQSDSLFGSVGNIAEWVRENFEKIETGIPEKMLPGYFEDLKKWSLEPSNKRMADMIKRQANGFVRECHGDLHLGNIAVINNRVTPFDCIEFNPNLRWIDTTSEIAFVAMDLFAHGYPEFAWQFINRYLEQNGDYSGLALLSYYIVYRAMVRAKVESLRIALESTAINRDNDSCQKITRHLDLAHQWAGVRRPAIIIMHGLSGSGKSTLARQLVAGIGAIRIRSDVERKRLFDLEPKDNSGSAIGESIYTQEATKRTYNQLESLARNIVLAGFTVIVDASFLKLLHRQQFMQLARKCEAAFLILSCETSEDILTERIERRRQSQNDPSEANLEVLQHQLQTQEPITAEEQAHMEIISGTAQKLGTEQLHTLKQHIKTAGRT